jgi:hypothetical protein
MIIHGAYTKSIGSYVHAVNHDIIKTPRERVKTLEASDTPTRCSLVGRDKTWLETTDDNLNESLRRILKLTTRG